MVYADLHVHTDCSDGQLALSEVPVAAWRAGVDAVGITDHDRIHPDLDAPVVETTLSDETTVDFGTPAGPTDADPITLIRGIELRVDAGDQRVDLLGYGVERTPDIDAVIDRIQADRAERGQRIVECVEDRLSVDLGVDPGVGFGRPHVARAIAAHPDLAMSYDAAFDDLIGDDGPCYVARSIPSFQKGVSVLSEACRLIALAHPLRYDDPVAALNLCADLDGVERYYPYDQQVDHALVEGTVDEYDLAVTGGSDAHDDRLGRAGLSLSDYRHISRRITQGSSGGES